MKKNNVINMTLRINLDDINKDIYFLDNTHDKYLIDGKEVYHNHDNLKELNESNVELYINNEKMKYKKYFNPEKEGPYEIKLIIKIDIKDCSYMFCDCNKITNLDLSSFDTKNVTNMSYMFSGCKNITNLDLSLFDTKNVTKMNHMFIGCTNISNLDLSSFDTKNVTDMCHMFYACGNISNIDLSSFDTKNVIDMSYMFSFCHKYIKFRFIFF